MVTLPICAARSVGHCETTTELLVPFAAEFVKKLDLTAGRIDMQLPDGLLDLDAPLSGEEKQRQKTEADEARAAGESKDVAPNEVRDHHDFSGLFSRTAGLWHRATGARIWAH